MKTLATASQCAHCAQPVPAGLIIRSTISLPINSLSSLNSPSSPNVSTQEPTIQTSEPLFCCYGCKAVYELIIEQGLTDFYQQVDRPLLPAINADDSDSTKPPSQASKASQAIGHDSPTDKKILRHLNPKDKRLDEPMILKEYIRPARAMQSQPNETALLFEVLIAIEGLTCAACGWLNEHYLQSQKGISLAHVNMATHQVLVQFDPKTIALSHILAAIRALGYIPNPLPSSGSYRESHLDSNPDHASAEAHQGPSNTNAIDPAKRARRQIIWKIFISGFGAMQAMSFSFPLYFAQENGIDALDASILRWTTLLIVTPVLFYTSIEYFKRCARDIRLRRLGMDVPISLGIFIGYIHSAVNTWQGSGDIYLDSLCMLLFFLLSGRYFEMLANQKITDALYSHLHSQPLTAWKRSQPDKFSSEPWQNISAHALVIGDEILVKHGETVPADGLALPDPMASAPPSIIAELDESMLSGESAPVLKKRFDVVHAGSINLSQPFSMQVTATGIGKVRREIEHLVARALASKPRFIGLAALVARYFIAGLLILSCITFGLWMLLGTERALDHAIRNTVALMIITCPCALALAAPLTLSSLMAVLLKKGCLLQNAAVLDHVSDLTDVVIDKTGTLTHGRLQVVDIQCHNTTDLWHRDRALFIANTIEQKSEHPIGAALRQAWREHIHTTATPKTLPSCTVQNLHMMAGQGIEATMDWHGDAPPQTYRIGTAAFCGLTTAQEALFDDINSQQSSAKHSKTSAMQAFTHLYLVLISQATPQSPIPKVEQMAKFSLCDDIRPYARAVLAAWQQKGIAIHVLSGDRREAVAQLGEALQLPAVDLHAEQSATQKADFVKALQNKGGTVMMIGDGVNDAPVLACANISVGMPNASDISKTSADIVLIGGIEPWQRIHESIEKIQQARSILHSNYLWTTVYNLTMVPVAMLGFVGPGLAALGMTLSSLWVVGQSLRIFKNKVHR